MRHFKKTHSEPILAVAVGMAHHIHLNVVSPGIDGMLIALQRFFWEVARGPPTFSQLSSKCKWLAEVRMRAVLKLALFRGCCGLLSSAPIPTMHSRTVMPQTVLHLWAMMVVESPLAVHLTRGDRTAMVNT